MKSRNEALSRAKSRALSLVATGQLTPALNAFMRDLSHHPDLCDNAALELCLPLQGTGKLRTAAQIYAFIEGTR